MILIADSGSTKTTWVLLENGQVKQTIGTGGLNPYFHNSESVEAVMKADLVPFVVADNIRDVHFYGAGCSTEYNNSMIRDAILHYFRKANVNIYHDILGAARALFGTAEGIACILGTGCNSCYFDGARPHSKVDSLGYLYGDEGAGSYLGKMFMGAYLKRKLPLDIRREFDATYNYSLEDILNSIYNRPFPNRFLASFSEFMFTRKEHPYLHRMISDSFLAFFDAQIRQYDNYKTLPVSFIGSIAFYYQDILKQLAADEGIRIGRILQNPIEGLIEYHRKINHVISPNSSSV